MQESGGRELGRERRKLKLLPGSTPGWGEGPPAPHVKPGIQGSSRVQRGRRETGWGRPPRGWAGEGGQWGEVAGAGPGGVKASPAPGAGGGQAGSR